MSQEGADKAKLKNLARLVEIEGELLEKLAAVHAEMLVVLAGGPTIGARIRQVETAWIAVWGKRYGGRYVFRKTIEVAAVKRLLATFTPAELIPRMELYLADEFYVPRRHPLAQFCADINRWAPEDATAAAPADAPGDCKHQPPCRSDAEHTSRRREERRIS